MVDEDRGVLSRVAEDKHVIGRVARSIVRRAVRYGNALVRAGGERYIESIGAVEEVGRSILHHQRTRVLTRRYGLGIAPRLPFITRNHPFYRPRRSRNGE
eukprot:CAMPEP_0196240970 /NCGR_PEP_ID=MMETSP0913-20130531/19668_1 /TAXON_ID=49265 /ORGANISM="Thalassiosira rotula, Strain GSO102" /LENGTH=99 /DNA_ID=CAMNT_0041523539 /DNA_START=710 /DNA_END=1009 /DNA_ORIENTATION=-